MHPAEASSRTHCWNELPSNRASTRSADLAVAVEVFAEALLDLAEQPRRHLVVLALGGDDELQFRVELERLHAVGASLEVRVDALAGTVGEFVVEELFELTKRFVAIRHGWHPSGNRWLRMERRSTRSGRARWRTRTTACASLFFPDAAGSSPCRPECRASRRSPCTRSPPRRRAERGCGSSPAGPRAHPSPRRR